MYYAFKSSTLELFDRRCKERQEKNSDDGRFVRFRISLSVVIESWLGKEREGKWGTSIKKVISKKDLEILWRIENKLM